MHKMQDFGGLKITHFWGRELGAPKISSVRNLQLSENCDFFHLLLFSPLCHCPRSLSVVNLLTDIYLELPFFCFFLMFVVHAATLT